MAGARRRPGSPPAAVAPGGGQRRGSVRAGELGRRPGRDGRAAHCGDRSPRRSGRRRGRRRVALRRHREPGLDPGVERSGPHLEPDGRLRAPPEHLLGGRARRHRVDRRHRRRARRRRLRPGRARADLGIEHPRHQPPPVAVRAGRPASRGPPGGGRPGAHPHRRGGRHPPGPAPRHRRRPGSRPVPGHRGRRRGRRGLPRPALPGLVRVRGVAGGVDTGTHRGRHRGGGGRRGGPGPGHRGRPAPGRTDRPRHPAPGPRRPGHAGGELPARRHRRLRPARRRLALLLHRVVQGVQRGPGPGRPPRPRPAPHPHHDPSGRAPHGHRPHADPTTVLRSMPS